MNAARIFDNPPVVIFSRAGSTWIRLRGRLRFSVFNVMRHTATVPDGFECDGASIPRAFWRVIGTPFDCDYVYEAVVHDWLYQTQILPRSIADKWFFDALAGKPRLRVRRYLIYGAVRAFGWIAWKKKRKNRGRR